jgi:transposase
MRAYVAAWPERVWAIEGCAGIGGHVASRLLGDGEQVVDVPPKLSARARVFSTGQGRKTDATDAHSVALLGTRMSGLRPVVDDAQLAVLRVLVDRRRSLGEHLTLSRGAGRDDPPRPSGGSPPKGDSEQRTGAVGSASNARR